MESFSAISEETIDASAVLRLFKSFVIPNWFSKYLKREAFSSTPSGQQQEFTLMENFAILH